MSETQPLLTIIVPVYNEAVTVAALLEKVASSPYRFPAAQVIIVDDGSTDGTPAALIAFRDRPGVVTLRHDANCGKGQAVQSALAHATGKVVLIQDADLEYDPQDYRLLVEPILAGHAAAVYGSRYLRPSRSLPWSKYRLAVVILNLIVRVLYRQRLTDEATCYKALRTDLLRSLQIRSLRFELCAEITAKLCRLKVEIMEVPVSYAPRTVQEGKKIRLRDALLSVITLVRYRFSTPAT